MKRVYKKGYLIILEAVGVYVVKNIKSKKWVFFKSIDVAKMLVNIERKKKLPKNPYFAKKIAKVTSDHEYRKKLLEFKESKVTFKDFENMVKNNKGINVERCL